MELKWSKTTAHSSIINSWAVFLTEMPAIRAQIIIFCSFNIDPNSYETCFFIHLSRFFLSCVTRLCNILNIIKKKKRRWKVWCWINLHYCDIYFSHCYSLPLIRYCFLRAHKQELKSQSLRKSEIKQKSWRRFLRNTVLLEFHFTLEYLSFLLEFSTLPCLGKAALLLYFCFKNGFKCQHNTGKQTNKSWEEI